MKAPRCQSQFGLSLEGPKMFGGLKPPEHWHGRGRSGTNVGALRGISSSVCIRTTRLVSLHGLVCTQPTCNKQHTVGSCGLLVGVVPLTCMCLCVGFSKANACTRVFTPHVYRTPKGTASCRVLHPSALPASMCHDHALPRSTCMPFNLRLANVPIGRTASGWCCPHTNRCGASR